MLALAPYAGKFAYTKLVPLPVLVEMPVMALQFSNALSGMTVKSELDGNTIVPFRLEQPSNAETPRDFKPEGK